jgi:hypothetical protein
MTEIEDRLRAAMHAAVDDAAPPPNLVAVVIRRHHRHVGVAACLTVLAVALAVVPAAVAASHGNRHGTQPALGGSPAPSRPSGPASFRHLPARFRGLPIPAADIPLPLPLSGDRPAWFRAVTGQRRELRTEPIAGLPFSTNGYNLTRVQGGWVAEPFPGAPACCAGPAVPLYFVADGARTARRIGTGYSASAAEQTGAVWLTTYQGRATRIGTARAMVREVTVSGAALGPAVHLPAGYYLDRAVGSDLLLSKVDQGPLPDVDKLWNPVTGRVVRAITGVIGASDTQIAWQSSLSCGSCVLRLANELTGASVSVALPRNTRAFGGTFSADGRLLAIAMSTSASPRGKVALARLAVIDTISGRLTILPGTSVRAVTIDVLSFGWLAGSHRLVATLGHLDGPVQIASWRPGDPHLRVARLVPPPGMWPVVGESG